MDKCRKCGQDLETDDRFCRNCGEPVDTEEKESSEIINDEEKDMEIKEETEKVSQDTIVPTKTEKQDSIETIDLSLVEKARKEEIKREIEELKNREEEQTREYKDYELEKTQIIGNINEYIDDEVEDRQEYRRPKRPVEPEYDYDEDNDNNKKKILIGVGIGIAVVLMVLAMFFLRESKEVNKEELIDNFIKALDNRNASELVGLLKTTDSNLKIDKKGINAYFKYIDENPSYIEKVRFELEEQSKFYDQNRNKDIGDRFENVVMRYKDGQYYLDMKPYYLKIKVPSANVELYLEDEKIDTTSSDRYEREFGPFMPGIYEIKGKIISGGANDEVMEKIVLFEEKPDTSKVSKTVELDLKLVSFKIETDTKDAFLIVNGEKTSTRVKDLPNGTFGPISKSTKLQLGLETPFGELKSKEVAVSDINNSVKLNIDFTSEVVVDGLTKSINSFIQEDIKAMQTLDSSVYTNLVDPELSNRKQMIEEMKDLNQSVESKLNKISYDLNSLKITQVDGRYYSSIVVKIDLEQTFYTEFSVDTSNDPKYGEYTAVYNDSKKIWDITIIENTSNFNLANTKDFKF